MRELLSGHRMVRTKMASKRQVSLPGFGSCLVISVGFNAADREILGTDYVLLRYTLMVGVRASHRTVLPSVSIEI